jgi:hypothetical protein
MTAAGSAQTTATPIVTALKLLWDGVSGYLA